MVSEYRRIARAFAGKGSHSWDMPWVAYGHVLKVGVARLRRLRVKNLEDREEDVETFLARLLLLDIERPRELIVFVL